MGWWRREERVEGQGGSVCSSWRAWLDSYNRPSTVKIGPWACVVAVSEVEGAGFASDGYETRT